MIWKRVIVAFVVNHIDEGQSIAGSEVVVKMQNTLIVVNGGSGRGDKSVVGQVRHRNESVDVVLHDRIDQVAAGSGAALTWSGQVVERNIVSGVGIDKLFAA